MPKLEKPKSKASNAEGKEKEDASKSDAKNKKEDKKKDRPNNHILQHNGISSPNINSWVASMNNPEIFSRLDLSLPWSSSLFKEGLDISQY